MSLPLTVNKAPFLSNNSQEVSGLQQQNSSSASSPAFGSIPWTAMVDPSWVRQSASNLPMMDTSWLANMVDPQSVVQQLGNNYVSYSNIPTDLLTWRHARQLQMSQGQSVPGLFNNQSSTMQSFQTQQSNPSTDQNSALTMQAADQAYEHSHFRHAIGLYNQVLTQDPRNASAYNRRGLAKAAIRDNPGAISDYTMAIAVAPNFYNAYLNRGNLWMYAKDYQRSLADYGKAIEINPTNRAAYENRSELFDLLNRHDQSLNDRATVIRLEKARMDRLRPQPAHYSQRIALVLGNDNYPGEANDLHGGPLRDAQQVTQQLEKNGFNVITGFNLTGPQTEEKVAQLVEALRQNPGSVSLIYYSGHGGSINGNNYLVPVEYTGNNANEVLKNAVSVDYLLKQLKLAPSTFNMIFLDACRTRLENGLPGDAASGRSRKPSFRSQNNPPAVDDWNVQNTPAQDIRTASKRWEVEPGPALTNTWVEYASRPDTIAVQTDGQGLYTKYLLKYMDQPGLNLEEVSMYTNYALEKDPDAIAQNQHARTQTDLSKTEPLAESFYFKQPTAYMPARPQSGVQRAV